ncbi:MAG: hypothetical protein IKX70_07460 [Treponema sp.]|nr:hypothetical protein [Treponema sp.]
MKKKMLSTLAFIVILCMNTLYGQSYNTKQLYRDGVYGQTFEITEYADGDKCCLLITMSDNKNNNTQVQTFDSTLPTVYYIWSKWFTSPSEYSNAIDSCKSFLSVSMNYIYLADIKDICDIAPCCKKLDYSIAKTNQGSQYIRLEYDCSDLNLFIEIAEKYNTKGRDYVLKNY